MRRISSHPPPSSPHPPSASVNQSQFSIRAGQSEPFIVMSFSSCCVVLVLLSCRSSENEDKRRCGVSFCTMTLRSVRSEQRFSSFIHHLHHLHPPIYLLQQFLIFFIHFCSRNNDIIALCTRTHARTLTIRTCCSWFAVCSTAEVFLCFSLHLDVFLMAQKQKVCMWWFEM